MKCIASLDPDQVKYLKDMLNDRYEEIVDPGSVVENFEAKFLVAIFNELEMAQIMGEDRSMIEWHSVNEKPTDYKRVLVKLKSGVIIIDTAMPSDDDGLILGRNKVDLVESWAHLPGGGEEWE